MTTVSATGTPTTGASGAEAPRAPEVPYTPPSFDEVYEAHVDFLWRSARGLGVPPASVDDVLQDVFVVVHRRLPHFEGRAAIRTWLARILVRVVQEHRRRFRRREDHATLPEELADPSARGPHDEVARAQAVRMLEAILDAMQEDQRTVFVLAEIEQMPAPEIAVALEINVNTVYSRLRLARREYERQLARIRAKDGWRQS